MMTATASEMQIHDYENYLFVLCDYQVLSCADFRKECRRVGLEEENEYIPALCYLYEYLTGIETSWHGK